MQSYLRGAIASATDAIHTNEPKLILRTSVAQWHRHVGRLGLGDESHSARPGGPGERPTDPNGPMWDCRPRLGTVGGLRPHDTTPRHSAAGSSLVLDVVVSSDQSGHSKSLAMPSRKSFRSTIAVVSPEARASFTSAMIPLKSG